MSVLFEKFCSTGREQYNNALKNDAIYSSSEYILSEIADEKMQPSLVVSNILKVLTYVPNCQKLILSKSLTQTLRYPKVQASVLLLNHHQNAFHQ